MDGVTFLRKIMALRPMPVVMISTLTQTGAEITLEALEIGAVDFVAKPSHEHGQAMVGLAGRAASKRSSPRRSARVGVPGAGAGAARRTAPARPRQPEDRC